MRPVPESITPPAPRAALRLEPPQPSPATCGYSNCRWPVYPTSHDFEASAATILLVLLCGLICGLILNTAIRCFLRCDGGGRSPPPAPHRRHRQQEQEQELEPKLGDSELIMAPAVTYAPGVTKLAGTEAECSICLTEFVEGDGIRVLETCSHGFHVECIERWLSSNKSCPTCRSSLVVNRCGSTVSEGGDHCRENANQQTVSAGESSSGGAASI
ncbi:RING-H2 finger protein ATL79-like [Rhodamnia argentea]|uniref:RING-type E3 ubiquitin transferase n=1 Tax=Rhodamnia argentea TaxID=178133 RepID=A0A8B8QYL9_9MYRT|nr:RING-H2 finger protein ATL79-like [Rhodamnia argentea]